MTHTYYHPRDLYVDRVQLWLHINCQDVAGFATFTDAGKVRWHIGSLKNFTGLPKHAKVEAWRPVMPDDFPDTLPEPMRLMEPPQWQSPPEPRSEPEAAESDHGWPYPHIRLGRPGQPPESVEECEARILRFLRTREHFERERPKIERLWPPELVTAAAVVDKMLKAAPTRQLAFLRRDDYADFFCDESDKRPMPARWDPTPRDTSEYEDGRVARWIVPGSGHYFGWRAARPPFSFRQIAEILRVDEDSARKHYRHQCERAFKRATG